MTELLRIVVVVANLVAAGELSNDYGLHFEQLVMSRRIPELMLLNIEVSQNLFNGWSLRWVAIQDLFDNSLKVWCDIC